MSRYDEVRVAYTDDHERRCLVGRSMTRHELGAEQHRQIVREVLQEVAVPDTSGLSRLGDPVVARGVPVLGMHGGLGGAIRGSKPHVDGLR